MLFCMYIAGVYRKYVTHTSTYADICAHVNTETEKNDTHAHHLLARIEATK